MEARDRTVHQPQDCDLEPRINFTVLHRSFRITKIGEHNSREILIFEYGDDFVVANTLP